MLFTYQKLYFSIMLLHLINNLNNLKILLQVYVLSINMAMLAIYF